MANDIIDINVYETTENVSITVNPNLTTININEVSGVGGSQNLQSVTNFGNTTTTSITANSFIKSGATSNDVLLGNGTTTPLSNLGTKNDINSKQLQLNYLDRDNSIFDAFYLRIIADSGTVESSNQLLSSLAVLRNISYINQGYTQQINADKFVKLGGTSAQYLMADGSTTTSGGGGGGATNLTTSQTSTNFTINSDTGTDAVVPLGNGTLAGATLNDYTTAEKTKLGKYPSTATNGKILQGNGTNYVEIDTPTGGIQNAIASGTDTYTATISGVTSYIDGDGFLIRFTNGNTTTSTLNVNGLGAIPLYRNNDGALIGGDIQVNGEMLCVYDSGTSVFKCIGTSPNSIIAYVTNADSVTITKGQAVYAFGGQGDRMTVKLASNISDSTSAQTVGIVMSTSIATNQKGFIMTIGLLDGLSTLPTSTFADGDTLYLGATAGTITNVKPYAPNHLVYLGVVTTASAGAAGRMYVKPQNGYELDEIHNVQARNPTLKDTLWFDNTVSPAQWKTASIATVLGYTPANDSSVVHLTGNETIAGNKSFTGTVDINLSANALKATSGQGTAMDIIGGNNSNPIGKFTRAVDSVEVARFDNTGLKLQLETIDTIASFDSNKNIKSLPTLTYPDLTELSRVKGLLFPVQGQLNNKQDTLQSTVNIKSINGNTILGSGNLTITASLPSQNQYTILANNTASTAVPTEQVFKNEPSKAYTGTITVTAGTPPSGATNHTYSWCQVGDLVTIRLNLDYATAGATVTSLACMLPSDCPNPELPSGVSTALNVISYGVGTMAANKASVATMGTAALRLKTTGPNTFDIQIQRASGSYATAYATIQYFV